jgi:hypothetical protein
MPPCGFIAASPIPQQLPPRTSQRARKPLSNPLSNIYRLQKRSNIPPLRTRSSSADNCINSNGHGFGIHKRGCGLTTPDAGATRATPHSHSVVNESANRLILCMFEARRKFHTVIFAFGERAVHSIIKLARHFTHVSSRCPFYGASRT